MDSRNPTEELCPKEQDSSSTEQQRYFGIKSYLHNFYETVTPKNASDFEDYDEDFDVHQVKEPGNRSRLCTCLLISGFSSMLCGAIMILIGFTFSRLNIDIGYQEEMRIIDKSAYDFNVHLDQIKVLGLIFFAMGGIFVSSAIILPGLMPNNSDDDDDNQDESTHFKLHIDDEANSRGANLIPITEELKVIQPKQESTTVITNSGLKQIELE